jgi:catecholate siderophore receptor
MSRHAGRSAQRFIQSRAGFVSVAALLCLSAPAKLAAQPATPTEQPPVTQQAPEPQQPATTPSVSPQQSPGQTVPATTQQAPLPTVSVQADRPKPRRTQAAVGTPTRTRLPTPPAPAAPATSPLPAAGTGLWGKPGTDPVGYVVNSTSTATKTNTQLLNIPQSITVLTKDFVKDIDAESLGEAIRYVPGVIPHQGESNRDDFVIRGQRSNADLFVNGFRDDAQIIRDLYNIARIEVLKGPNAMIFGRGGGGGVINRVLKEADGVPIHEVFVQGGQFDNKRVSVDFGNAVSSTMAGRFNAVYENSDSYRKFVNLERYGINPTFTYAPSAVTKIQLSYEYFHDQRTTDRGIPSQLVFGSARPLSPYQTDPSTYFGNPNLSYTKADVQSLMGVIEHEFDSGVKVRNASRYADYEKFYQNIYPGGGTDAGAVNAIKTASNLTAYNNQTDRENLFNQTDVTYKFDLGWMRHEILVGTEFGRQSGLNFRQDGFFPGNVNTIVVSPLNPVNFLPVRFTNIATGANNTYGLNLQATYFQDQMWLTKYLQFIVGGRYDRFDFASQDRRGGLPQTRVDNLVSPRYGVVIKPVEEFAIYGSYSKSYLPSSGDQFTVLNPGLVISVPEEFINKEVGVKWDPTPRLQITSAVYNLVRLNQRLPDPNNAGFFLLSGKTVTNGFEAGVSGYITDAWQMAGGYAYTDARIEGATSATVTPGNRVGLVPYNTFSLWNKYQFTPMWGAGVGVIYLTDYYASSDNTVALPGFTRVDAAVYGRINERYSWQINVENLFNQNYISTADGNNNITPGSPRAIRGSMTARF